MILAIDPGSTESALLWWDGKGVAASLYRPNDSILERLKQGVGVGWPLVIEKIASFGMPVGAEVFETVYWSGRFAQAYGPELTHRITRIEVKNHLCHSSRAKDSNIRQALIDRFGAPGTKKNPGALYGISGDLWSALAVAVTWSDQMCGEIQEPGLIAG